MFGHERQKGTVDMTVKAYKLRRFFETVRVPYCVCVDVLAIELKMAP